MTGDLSRVDDARRPPLPMQRMAARARDAGNTSASDTAQGFGTRPKQHAKPETIASTFASVTARGRRGAFDSRRGDKAARPDEKQCERRHNQRGG